MKFLTKLKHFIPDFKYNQPIVLLGRWKIDYCQLKINKKIDLSNEDHCGTCNIKKKYKNINKIIFFETI